MDELDASAEKALGRGWLDDAPWDLLTSLTALPERMGGHPGERRAAELVADAFADAGVESIVKQSFELTRWNRGRTDFAVVDPVERSFEAIALPYSPPGDIEADLVDVGYGTPEEIEGVDVAGTVVVASATTPPDAGRFIHRSQVKNCSDDQQD